MRELPVEGKRVFVRVDFNVPLNELGEIRDDFRIRMTLPTIRLLIEQEAIVVLGSHLGKPKGKPNPKLSLRPVGERLESLLGQRVFFAPDCTGPEAVRFLEEVPGGSVVLLENLRFHPGEERNDPDFAKALAVLVDFYVNDAFSAAHRAHASIVGMPRFFAKPAAGLLMEKELVYLSKVTESPARPFVVIIGGAKISDKAGVITNLLPKVDHLLVGGGVAFNFLKLREVVVNCRLLVVRKEVEPELLDMVAGLREEPKIVLPVDMVVASGIEAAEGTTVPSEAIPEEMIGLDIGAETVKLFGEIIKQAKTIVWVGPMGVFEREPFSQGTRAVAQAMAEATEHQAITVVGGGDTAAALAKFSYGERVSHISTGGGATLEFLGGKVLPGVAVLAEAEGGSW